MKLFMGLLIVFGKVEMGRYGEISRFHSLFRAFEGICGKKGGVAGNSCCNEYPGAASKGMEANLRGATQ